MKLEFLIEEDIVKAHTPSVDKLSKQMLKTACKHFHGDRELAAAKQMAADFYKRLVQNIESEYKAMKGQRGGKGSTYKLSLSESFDRDDDWSEDYAPDTGSSAICPECGSSDVGSITGDAAKARLMAMKHLCNDCGHESKWWGPDAHIAQSKFGGRGYK